MALFSDNIRQVLWVAVVPAILSVGSLVFGVKEPAQNHGPSKTGLRFRLQAPRQLPPSFWWTVVLGSVFTLARFSEAFLVLRVQDVGLALRYIPLVLIVMNVVYMFSAYPAGIFSDRSSPRHLLMGGLIVLVIADVVLAIATTSLGALLGVALWGLHMGMTQGLFAKLVADTVPARLRGSAFGVFNLVSGLALLFASVVAGVAWSTIGPEATFGIGGGLALLTLSGLAVYSPTRQLGH